MPLECKVTAIGKDLDKSEHYRDNDIPLQIELSSAGELNLVGATLALEVINYTTGVAQMVVTKSTQSTPSAITLVSQTPTKLLAKSSILDSDLASLPADDPIMLNFKVQATIEGFYRTVLEGSFTSKPDSP